MDLRHLNEKALLVLGAIVVAAALLFGPVSGPLADSALYADIAQNLLLHGSFNSNFAPSTQNPFLPLVLSVFMALFGGFWDKAFLAFNGLALLAAIWLFARQAVGEKAALPAALVFLAAPVLVYAGLDLLTDALFLTLSLFGAWAYLRLLKGFNNKDAAVFVAANALAILTRNTGFLLVVIYGLHLAWQLLGRKQNPAAKTIGATAASVLGKLALLVVVFALVGAAWNARNLASNMDDSSGHYAGLLQKSFSVEISLQSPGGKTAFMLSETRIDTNGQQTLLNTPLRLTLPFNVGNADFAVPIQVAYFIRLIAYLFIFVGPVLVLSAAWRTIEAAKAKGTVAINPVFSFLLVWFAVFAGFHVLWPAAFSMRYVAPLVVPLAVCFGKAVADGMEKNKSGGNGEGNGRNGKTGNDGRGGSWKTWKKEGLVLMGLLALQLLFSAAVVSWDIKARWAPSKAAADGFEKMGAWLEANTPQGSTITAAGVPVNAISFYGKRKAIQKEGDYIALSDYLPATEAIHGDLSKCIVYNFNNTYWKFAIVSRTNCP